MPRQKSRPTYIGIDISKATLDVAAGDQRLRVTNNRAGFTEMLAAVRALRKHVHFIFESTGHYGDALRAFLHTHRCRLSVVSGFHARQFAKARSKRAKTDALDAALLAEFGRALAPPVTLRPDRRQVKLTRLMRRQRQLIELRSMQKIQLSVAGDAAIRRDITEVIDFLTPRVDQMETSAKEIVAECPVLSAKHAALRAIEGVGERTAIGVLAELPELGTLSRKVVAALGGLAPLNRDTGESIGVRRIGGGRKSLRTLLYMPAVASTRLNPVLKPYYRQLRDRGKPHRVAIVAVMRKMLIRMNQVAKEALARPQPSIPVAAPPKKYRRWSRDDDSRLLKLMKENMPVSLISRELFRTDYAVRARMAGLNAHEPMAITKD